MDQSKINALREQEVGDRPLYIGGQALMTQARRPVTSPIDGSDLATLSEGAAEHVDQAVSAGRAAFKAGTWSKMAPAQRKRIMHKIADLIEAHALELAVLGVRDNGTEIGMAIKAEPGSCAATFRFYAECVDKVAGDIMPTAPGTMGLIHKEPIGLVGVITPWNFPLMIGAWKIAPALAMGNSVIIKPPVEASLSTLRLIELCYEAGLPEGVLSCVTGSGSVVGSAIAHHMDIDCLVFTGSGATGRRLLEASAKSNMKPCYLELGGKSPNIIFDDCEPLDGALKVSAGGIFRNSGQVCVAGSRLLVQSSIYDQVCERMGQLADSFKVGDPLDLGTDIGAVTSAGQLTTDLQHIAWAEADGARRVTGGQQILQDTGGTYMQPTVYADVTPDMRLNTEEVFGPVLGIMKFDTEQEAAELANSTVYGLAAGVWTSNLGRAHRMVEAIDAGVVHVNTYGGPDVTVPLAGHKQSGNGADKSLYALDKYLKLKTAWLQL